MKSQRIIRLEAENIKRLSAVEIEPNGNLIVVSGKNKQGKTSVLDTIEMAFGGKKSVPAQPIRRGSKKARILIETNDFVVSRHFTKSGSRLELKGKDGEAYSSPQKMLDSLLGSLSFDPLEFSRMEQREQLEELKSVIGLDFNKLDAKRQSIFEERTQCNRDLKAAKAALQNCPCHDDIPDSLSSMDDLSQLFQSQLESNRKNDEQRARLVDLREQAVCAKEEVNARKQEIEVLEDRIVSLKDELSKWRTKLSDLNTEGKEFAKKANALQDEDTDMTREKMQKLEETNTLVRQNIEHDKLKSRASEFAKQHKALTEKIDGIDDDKRLQIEKAEFPVDGLGLSEDGVLLNGLPLDQASGAEQLAVSLALGIALNKELRVVLVRDGSLLDEDSLRLVAEMAAKADCQVWLERVGDSNGGPGMTVVIEDGSIKSEPESEK